MKFKKKVYKEVETKPFKKLEVSNSFIIKHYKAKTELI